MYIYLLINLISVLFPFIFSFHPKINFHKKFYALIPSISLTAILFIVWDYYFTKIGVWGFNPNYLLGYYVFNLPVEEIMFFICIPFSSIFIYESMISFNVPDYLKKIEKKITYSLLIISVLMSIFYYNYSYTFFIFGFSALFYSFQLLIFRSKFLSRFYFSYLIILLPFFIVNGILTGTGIDEPIVWYNNAENIGLRIGTIPLEDVFYGMLMLSLSISFYERILKRF